MFASHRWWIISGALSAGGMACVVAVGAVTYPAMSLQLILGGSLGGVLMLLAAGWLWLRRYDEQFRQMHRLLRGMDRYAAAAETEMESRIPPGPMGWEFRRLLQAARAGTASYRHRLAMLADQRRELEAQVQLLEADRCHLQALLGVMQDAVIITDAFNEVVRVSAGTGRLLGMGDGQMLARPIEQVLGDPGLVGWIKDVREGESPGASRSLQHVPDEGTDTAVYEVTLAGLPAVMREQGPASATGCAGVVTILRDVTREQEQGEIRQDFVSSVSHEFRTPLASIKAYMEMLVDGEAADEETRQDFYNIIQSETNRLSRLVDNVLSISRIESGAARVQRERVDLRDLGRQVLDILMPQARASRLDLMVRPSDQPCVVEADRDLLLQALMNLVGNAVKYTPGGGLVELAIGADPTRQQVRVQVRDTGVGIPEADLPHVFEKFYRVNDHKKLAKGTGLGLNLVKHIVESVHAGQVRVESRVGVGSTFRLILPMADISMDEPVARSSAA